MSRYLLAVMGVLAISACTNDRPYDRTSDGVDSTPRNQTDDKYNTDYEERNKSTLTAGDQSGSESDRRITQQIRQAVVNDSELSTKAQNCTIITIDGVVTLRGSVDTAAERSSVSSKADRVSGVRRVDNNLEVLR